MRSFARKEWAQNNQMIGVGEGFTSAGIKASATTARASDSVVKQLSQRRRAGRGGFVELRSQVL
jgi:hypothetical protein